MTDVLRPPRGARCRSGHMGRGEPDGRDGDICGHEGVAEVLAPLHVAERKAGPQPAALGPRARVGGLVRQRAQDAGGQQVPLHLRSELLDREDVDPVAADGGDDVIRAGLPRRAFTSTSGVTGHVISRARNARPATPAATAPAPTAEACSTG